MPPMPPAFASSAPNSSEGAAEPWPQMLMPDCEESKRLIDWVDNGKCEIRPAWVLSCSAVVGAPGRFAHPLVSPL